MNQSPITISVGTNLNVSPTFSAQFAAQVQGVQHGRIFYLNKPIEGNKMLFLDELLDYVERGIVQISNFTSNK